MSAFATTKSRIDQLSLFYNFSTDVDVLRLDLIHPLISGNKWFKLKHYLQAAKKTGKNTLVTFGGAFSNHIVATAAAAEMEGFKSIGIIRGERPAVLSKTLQDAAGFGMSLFFVDREFYRKKLIPSEVLERYKPAEVYTIPEGGYGNPGAAGAKDILAQAHSASYTHIVAAVGTGTTLAGLVLTALPGQKIIGVSAMKNNFSLQGEIEALLPPEKQAQFNLLHQYHFGGYAKYNKELLQFMNDLYRRAAIPTDLVYTGKAFYAVFDLIENGKFRPTDKVLIVHTGGLQGNRSLGTGTLIFDC